MKHTAEGTILQNSISRKKALQHLEIQPDKPDKLDHKNSGNKASNKAGNPFSDDKEPITKDYVMNLVPRNNRPAKYKAKKVADKIDSLCSRIAILERENAGFKAEKEVREKTTCRRTIPNRNAEFTTIFEIGQKDFTIEALKELSRPQKRRKVAAVKVKVEPEEVDDKASEAKVRPQRTRREGRQIQRPARYGN
jgi:hypothetical protein